MSKEMELKIEDLYEDYWEKMLCQVCMKYTNNRDQAEDWCQNGFIKIYNKLHKYENTGSLEGWVRRIIRNTIIDDLRKKKFEFTDNRYEDVLVSVDEEIDRASMMLEIMRVKENLSPSYKRVFELHVFQELKHREIAELLKISEGTSKSNYSKAKKAIRKMLLTNKN